MARRRSPESTSRRAWRGRRLRFEHCERRDLLAGDVTGDVTGLFQGWGSTTQTVDWAEFYHYANSDAAVVVRATNGSVQHALDASGQIRHIVGGLGQLEGGLWPAYQPQVDGVEITITDGVVRIVPRTEPVRIPAEPPTEPNQPNGPELVSLAGLFDDSQPAAATSNQRAAPQHVAAAGGPLATGAQRRVTAPAGTQVALAMMPDRDALDRAWVWQTHGVAADEPLADTVPDRSEPAQESRGERDPSPPTRADRAGRRPVEPHVPADAPEQAPIATPAAVTFHSEPVGEDADGSDVAAVSARDAALADWRAERVSSGEDEPWWGDAIAPRGLWAAAGIGALLAARACVVSETIQRPRRKRDA